MDYDPGRQGVADDEQAPPRFSRFDLATEEDEQGDTPPRTRVGSPAAAAAADSLRESDREGDAAQLCAPSERTGSVEGTGRRSSTAGPQSLPLAAGNSARRPSSSNGLRERPSRSSEAAAPSSAATDETEEKPRARPAAPPLSPFDPLALALLSAFSILGCLCRLGLNALFSYEGESVFPLVWSQAVGCFLMGVALAKKAALENSALGPALYVGWTTGLCGSITTFSSWMLQTFSAFSNINRLPRRGLHDATDGVAQIVITISVSFFSLHFGRRLAQYIPSPQPLRTPSKPAQAVAALFGFAMYLSAILALALSHRAWEGHRVLFALVLAPPGTVVRWWLARANKLSLRFPTAGTFVANQLATAVLAASYLVQRIVPVGQGLTGTQCQALQGIEDGFCGSLSTVSTFMTELDALSARAAEAHEQRAADKSVAGARMGWLEREAVWVYGAGSVLCGVALVVLVLGVGWWVSPRGLGSMCTYR